MTYLEAAYKILKDSKQPLHYNEITRLALEKEMIESRGVTPELTMNAVLFRDIKNKKDKSLFRSKGRGFFVLNELEKDILGLQLNLFKIEEELATQDNYNLYTGKGGEYLVAGELLLRGFNANLLSVDEGIDLIAKKNNKFFYVQVKTANKSKVHRYNFNIRVTAFEKNYSESTFYIFVLKEKDSHKFIILSHQIINEFIKDKIIRKIVKGKYYLVPLRQEKNKIFLRNKDLSEYVNNWNL